MGTGSDKKGQDKKRIRERDSENGKLEDKLRNVRLRWYGHVKRREEGYVGKRMMEMAVLRRKTKSIG